MILKLYRVSLHPWCLYTLLRAAVNRFVDGVTVERRKAAAEFHRALRGMFDPCDTMIESPYVQLSFFDLRERKLRNEALEAQFPDTFKSHPDYRALPNQMLRATVDLTRDAKHLCEDAMAAFAANPEARNDVAEAIIDTIDALKEATVVEVDSAAKA